MYWLVGLLALSFLIVVHEAGHYVVARWCKMRVDRFSVGFGPGLLKRKSKSGTVFQLAPIPFGGFVEISGMNVVEDVDPNDVNSYANRPVLQRFLTILAGPATNFLSAFLLAFLLYNVWGVRSTERWFAVDSFQKDSPAKGILEVGDRIIIVNDSPLYFVSPSGEVTADALKASVNKNHGAPVRMTVIRHDKLVSVTVTPKAAEQDGKPVLEDGKPIYRLGIVQKADYDRVPVGVAASTKGAMLYPFAQSELIIDGIKNIITKKEKADVGGGIRMAEEFKKAFSMGFGEGLELVMALSVYLALFNLLPLPALDGGRLVFLAYEMITRRRANPKIESMVHMIGIMLLMVVMVLVTYKDCRRLF
jgi:regulator of sigma E protease